VVESRRSKVHAANQARVKALKELEETLPQDGSFTVSKLLGRLRAALSARTVLFNESITNYGPAWNHIDLPYRVVGIPRVLPASDVLSAPPLEHPLPPKRFKILLI